jgi:hypothetical protein
MSSNIARLKNLDISQFSLEFRTKSGTSSSVKLVFGREVRHISQSNLDFLANESKRTWIFRAMLLHSSGLFHEAILEMLYQAWTVLRVFKQDHYLATSSISFLLVSFWANRTS